VVATDAYSARGTVEPSRNAALLPLMVATKSGVPVGRSKDMWDESMCTVKPILRVRYRTESRLFLRSGTCKTLVNSTALTVLPSTTGLNTTVPTLHVDVTVHLPIQVGMRYINRVHVVVGWEEGDRI
jgi:hypothetical protein